mmetsp:Transcript_41297/g.117856  ORF Transcript_41297/g.117856 Transcript_41297/m.117856 type:complete len:302 (+) Transcript_41297:369-1274(+)
MPCSREGYVDAVVDREEAHRLVPVRAHQRDDDDVVLLALEVVHGRDGHVLGRRVALQLVLERAHLPKVGGEDGDPGFVVAALDEVRGEGADEICLVRVCLRVALALVVLEVAVRQEEATRIDPHDLWVIADGEVVPKLRIERLDEPRDLRMHAPLLQKRYMLASVFDEALKQRDVHVEVLGEAVNRCRRAQLLVVADEDHVLSARVEGSEDVGLEHLSGLLDDDHLRAQLLEEHLVLRDGRCGHAYKIHLAKHGKLPVPLEHCALHRISLELSADLRKALPGFVVGLEQPPPVHLLLLFDR